MKTNYPVNDHKTLYIQSSYTEIPYGDLLEQITSHFGHDINLNDLTIEAEYRHTQCIGYDQYDSGDYDNYIVIRKKINHDRATD